MHKNVGVVFLPFTNPGNCRHVQCICACVKLLPVWSCYWNHMREGGFVPRIVESWRMEGSGRHESSAVFTFVTHKGNTKATCMASLWGYTPRVWAFESPKNLFWILGREFRCDQVGTAITCKTCSDNHLSVSSYSIARKRIASFIVFGAVAARGTF